MLWRIRPIEVKVSLFLPAKGKTRPAVYSVWADDDSLGWLHKHPDTRTKQHRWRVTRGINDTKSLGSFACLDQAVDKLMTTAKKKDCPFTVTFDAGSVGGRPYDFGRAYSLGDSEDRVHLLIQKNPQDMLFYVDAVVDSKTVGCDFDLQVLGPFSSYEEAGEAGIEVALQWLTPGGVRVDADELAAIRQDIRSRPRRKKSPRPEG